MEEFYRIKRLPPYVFETVNKAKACAQPRRRQSSTRHGNPDLPAPQHVLDKLKETLGKRAPTAIRRQGHPRAAPRQAAYYARRFA